MPNCPLCHRRLSAAAFPLHLQAHDTGSAPQQHHGHHHPVAAPPPPTQRPGTCREGAASPSSCTSLLRGHDHSTQEKVTETSVSIPTLISVHGHLGDTSPVDFPTPQDVASVLAWLPEGRKRYSYPRTVLEWSEFSSPLRSQCNHLFGETHGARGIDELHRILHHLLVPLPTP